MSYEKELFNEVIYVAAGKLSPNDAADLLEWVESLEVAKLKADEYETKAKVLDRVKEFAEEPPFLLANNENADYERYAYDQILKLINKYESGESDV